MNTKIMEGLVGAGTNMRLTDTTMRVFRDARRRGDQGAMERAMDYTGDFTQKADEYQDKAQEGMEEEAREVREKQKAQMAEAVQKRKDEQKELEEKTAAKDPEADTVEISEEGKALLARSLDEKNGEDYSSVTSSSQKSSIQHLPLQYTNSGNSL